jgi:PAS domain S-box-containing protein
MPRKDPEVKGLGLISEELCRETIEKAPDAILFLDTKGKIVYCNAATARMTGFSKKDLVGEHFTRLGSLRLLDIPKYMLMFHDLLGGRDIKPFETTWRNKRGEAIYTEVYVGTVKEKGKIKWIQAIVRDLTERRGRSESLEESEERYRMMIEESAYAMMLIDTYGNLIFSNKATDAITGRQYIDDTGKDILRLGIISRDDIPKVKKAIGEILSGKKIEPFEIKMTRADNVDLIVEAHGIRMDYMGEPAILATLRDITAQKKAEEALKEGEERFRALFDYAPDAYYINDMKGTLVDVNKAVESLTGYTRKELVGKNYTQLKLLPPDQIPKALKILLGAATGKSTEPVELEFGRKDGGRVTVELKTYPMELKGRHLILGIAHDMTERKKAEEAMKESEEKYRSVVENATDQIFMLDKGGRFLSMNRAIANFLRKPANELIGKPISQFFPKEIAALFTKNMSGVFKTGKGKSLEEQVEIGGRTIYFSTNLNPVKNEKGETIAVTGIVRDVTERKKAEAALRESEEKYRGVTERSSDVIMICDLKGKISYISESVKKVLGYSPEELVGKAYNTLVSPQEVIKISKTMAMDIIKGRASANIEVEMKRKDGSLIMVEGSGAPIFHNGMPTGIQVVIRDITERKKAEAALRESEEKFRMIFDNASDGILVADEKTKKLIMCNKKIQNMLGYNEGEIKKMGVMDIHPKKDLPYVLEQFGKQARKEIALAKDLPVLRKDGSVFYADINSFPVTLAGKAYLTGVFRDVTERKKAEEEIRASEEKYRSLVENAVEFIYLISGDYRVISINKAGAELFGKSPEEILGKQLSDLFPKQMAGRYIEQIKNVFATGRALSSEVPLLTPRKSYWVKANLVPIKDKKGEVISVLGISSDISDLKKAEELIKNYASKLESDVRERTKELVSEKEKVEALSVVKDEFIKNISHELKTPLSVIMGNLTLLRDMASAGKEKEWSNMLDMMDRNSARLSESIDQILQVSKLGTAELKKEKIYIKELLNEVYKERLPIAKKKDLKFELQAESIVITGDSSLIRLAVSNLVSNAIKFTQKGSVAISAKARDGAVSISITDTGIGISPKNQKRVFERFFKADENAPGTGIGLNIAKQIVEKHSGSINVKSKLGKGSTFEIVLPRGA